MTELTNNLRKIFASLSTTKGRREHSMFMAQGTKCVLDTINYFDVACLMATDKWIEEHSSIAEFFDVTMVKHSDIERVTTLSTPPQVIAIYRIPAQETPAINNSLSIALDGIQDPGNLGTIIRVADWMGITQIIASPDTVDVWNPKVVQATMGAISRVNVYYAHLPGFLKDHDDIPLYGTFLNGENVYKAQLTSNGIIVMGNEGKGISEEVAASVKRRLLIPSYPQGRSTSESLNVAVATAIVVSEFRRRQY